MTQLPAPWPQVSVISIIDVLLVAGEELVWRSEADPELAALMTTAVQAVYRQGKIAELGLTPEEATWLLAQPPLRSRTLEPIDPE